VSEAVRRSRGEAIRALGLDLGERRIGVAISDSAGVLALPLCTIERSGDLGTDHAEIERIVKERGVNVVVVGLPLSLSGRMGPAAVAAKTESQVLSGELGASGVDVVTHDERLTTVEADRVLSSAGKRSKSRRKFVDQTAAAVILQAWLGARRPEGSAARG
jgi:putative Holliday junction resolvase